MDQPVTSLEDTIVAQLLVDPDAELVGLNTSLDRLVELLEQIRDDDAAQDGIREFIATSAGVWVGFGRPDIAAIFRQVLVVMLNVMNRRDHDG